MPGMTESAEPYREFISEMAIRIERAVLEIGRDSHQLLRESQEMIRESQVMMRESREDSKIILQETRAMRSDFIALWEEMGDMREESRAQTRALLAGIDRLGRGPGPAPAT
jgi:hypothetical protein